MSAPSLLPPGSTPLERAVEQTGARLLTIPAPIRSVWSPTDCTYALPDGTWRSGSTPPAARLVEDDFDMNDEPLSYGHGAPLRLRNEVQLGFKMVKWIKGVEFVAHFDEIGGGHGGYNNDHEFFGYSQSI